jgi:hypothetical protein
MNLGTEVFPFEKCQDALIRVRRAHIGQANAAIRV